MRHSDWRLWAGYGLSVAAGFYTHPFFALTLVAHGAYVAGVCALEPEQPEQKPSQHPEALRQLQFASGSSGLGWLTDRRLWWFSFMVVGSLVLYSPWIWVLLHQYKRAVATTDWTNAAVGISYLLKLWTLSFTSVFVDLDFGFSNPLTYLLRVPFVLLIWAALYRTYRSPVLQVRLFVVFTAVVPFLLLVIPDLLIGGKRSAVSRYLISCYPGIQLAVAYLFGSKLNSKFSSKLNKGRVFWRGVLGFSILCSLISGSVSAMAETWWNKDLSYHNAEVVRLVNAVADQRSGTTSPILISDIGDDATNMGDLVSMSYRLKPNVNLFLTSRPPSLTALGDPSGAFLLRASQSLETAIARQGWTTKPVSRPARLWQIEQP